MRSKHHFECVLLRGIEQSIDRHFIKKNNNQSIKVRVAINVENSVQSRTDKNENDEGKTIRYSSEKKQKEYECSLHDRRHGSECA